jgi:hypothetical protein
MPARVFGKSQPVGLQLGRGDQQKKKCGVGGANPDSRQFDYARDVGRLRAPSYGLSAKIWDGKNLAQSRKVIARGTAGSTRNCIATDYFICCCLESFTSD